MKYQLLILGLLFSNQSYAQSCGSLADGEIIRVDEENKSLQNFKVQDQDGLGSCYANAASLLLQGSLKNNPEISYLHLATLYKTQALSEQRDSAKSTNNFSIYAKQAANNQKAINGAGDAMKWDLAIDGGNTCGVIAAVKELEAKNKKPMACLKSEMNLEKILTSGDGEHKQFKTVLETSVYMNLFQKNFGDLNVKPNFFNRKKVLLAQEKYKSFKDSFQNLISRKQKTISEQSCSKVNADYLGPVIAPIIQSALTYQSCFKDDFPSKNDYWCKIIKGLVNNPKVNEDGSIEAGISKQEWLKSLQKKITQKKTNFTGQGLSDDMSDSFIESLGLSPLDSISAKRFLKERIIANTSVNKNLEDLASEYNEVLEKGFSPACVNRNTYNYFESKDYENDWQQSESLCSYSELMNQATNVIIKYKESGLDDIKTAMDFLTTNAGKNYDEAMMALYATDCDDKAKITLPQNISCQTLNVNSENKSEINSKILETLKANKPLTASLCSIILKKPKNQFAPNECGHHALGVTGIQCSGGKYKYLIQNSWGANNKASSSSVGIENIDGKGAYWFDETAFFDSVYGLDFIN